MDCDRALCVTSNSGMGGSKAQKKISNLKRKIRQQASKHVHSCKEKDLEIQVLFLQLERNPLFGLFIGSLFVYMGFLFRRYIKTMWIQMPSICFLAI